MKKIQIEQDLLAKFEEYPLDSIDRFMLQTHINNLADRLSQDRVKQARSYLKSIFGEIVDQDFLLKDPTRKLKTPRNLRPKDKQVLTWEQLWLALERTTRRDRLLLMLDMTERFGRASCSLCGGAPSMTWIRCRSPKPSTEGIFGPSERPMEASRTFTCLPA